MRKNTGIYIEPVGSHDSNPFLSIYRSNINEGKHMRGCFRTDSDGHWYFVPEKEMDAFEESKRKFSDVDEHSDEWYIYVDEFCERFDQYRLSGGIQHILCDIDGNGL